RARHERGGGHGQHLDGAVGGGLGERTRRSAEGDRRGRRRERGGDALGPGVHVLDELGDGRRHGVQVAVDAHLEPGADLARAPPPWYDGCSRGGKSVPAKAARVALMGGASADGTWLRTGAPGAAWAGASSSAMRALSLASWSSAVVASCPGLIARDARPSGVS